MESLHCFSAPVFIAATLVSRIHLREAKEEKPLQSATPRGFQNNNYCGNFMLFLSVLMGLSW